jgi:hypothetical protein
VRAFPTSPSFSISSSTSELIYVKETIKTFGLVDGCHPFEVNDRNIEFKGGLAGKRDDWWSYLHTTWCLDQFYSDVEAEGEE